ncbi:hypothetical protein B0T16DRAFT_497321 [Cercophora newfieldiana]|uniref:Uncharacterized protein n=1 Tax=Cercophora newfieldiana TaxID=92897 RepID=A0AA39XS21_9PEZI|nr:hypothetical protein B0T16DRAFT_497321 [Cercophora newfieldiana]
MDLAALFDHREVIEELVEHLDDAPNDKSRTLLSPALHIAASCGHLSCVKILLAARADPLVSYDYYLRMKDLQRADATVVERRGNASFAATQEGFDDVVQEIRQLQAQQTEQPLPGHRFVPRPPGTRYTSMVFNFNGFFKPVGIPTASSDLGLRDRGPTASFATKSSSDSPVSKNPLWPNGAPDDLFGGYEQSGKRTSTNPFRNKSKNAQSSSSATDDRGNKTISEGSFWAALGVPVVPMSSSKDSTSAVTTALLRRNFTSTASGAQELDGRECRPGSPTLSPPLCYDPPMDEYLRNPTGGFQYRNPPWAQDQIKQEEVPHFHI